MSNYSFMKSGVNLLDEGVSTDEVKKIQAMVMSFMDKALIDIAVYVEHTGRQEITPRDIKLGLKSETFKFMQRPDISQDIQKWTEYLEEETSDSECEEETIMNGTSEEFTKGECKCHICAFINSVEKKWDSWVPNEGLENILKNAVDKI